MVYTINMLHETIKTHLKEAMKAREATRLLVVRSVLTALTNELVSQKKTPQDLLSDEEVLKVITRLSKQRKDSIEQYTNANRPELAETEQAELVVLETYLPELMSRDDIKVVVEAKKVELGIEDKSQMGKFIGSVMSELKGKADGGLVKEVVEEVLS
jgi:uncharacterized protein